MSNLKKWAEQDFLQVKLLHSIVVNKILSDLEVWELYKSYSFSKLIVPEIIPEEFNAAVGNHLFDDQFEKLGLNNNIDGHSIRSWWQNHTTDNVNEYVFKNFIEIDFAVDNFLKKYIKFEIEKSQYSRNNLIGRSEKDGKVKRDNIMCFNSVVPKTIADKMIENFCEYYNNKLEFLNNQIKYFELKNNL